MTSVRYIAEHAIDKKKWDRCIEDATNSLIYAYSWYLDEQDIHWDALILNDYEAVMPLTWNKKYGIYYLFQPWFSASLGIFSRKKTTPELVVSFLKAIPAKFKYIDICLNHENHYSCNEFPSKNRITYTLSLKPDYELLKQGYRTQLQRNIQKAIKADLIVKEGIELSEIFPLAKEIFQRTSPISDKEFQCFIPLFEAVRKHQKLETWGIYNIRNELLASAVFFHAHNRWYYLLVGNHPNGKTLGASHYLLDRFIQRHAGSQDVLDFEGSDLRNIAYFYSSFGAKEEIYPALHQNRLPLWIRWLKR